MLFSFRSVFFITLYLIFNVVVNNECSAPDGNNSLWNYFRFLLNQNLGNNRINSGIINDNDVIIAGRNNYNWRSSQNNYFSDRSISSATPFLNTAEKINNSNLYYKTIYFDTNINNDKNNKYYFPSEVNDLSKVNFNNSFNKKHSNNSKYYYNGNAFISHNTNQSYLIREPQLLNNTVTRKNTRKPFVATEFVKQPNINFSNKLQTTHLNKTRLTTPFPIATITKSIPDKFKPSVRLDDDDDDEDDEDEEEDEEDEEEYDEDDDGGTGFESGFEESEEDEDDVDANHSTDLDLKDEEKFEDDIYEDSEGNSSKKKKGKKKKKKKKKGKKKGKGKMKHLKKLKKYMFPLLLAYKLKFFTLIPLLLGGLVLIVGTTGFAGFFFALFAIGLSLQKH